MTVSAQRPPHASEMTKMTGSGVRANAPVLEAQSRVSADSIAAAARELAAR